MLFLVGRSRRLTLFNHFVARLDRRVLLVDFVYTGFDERDGFFKRVYFGGKISYLHVVGSDFFLQRNRRLFKILQLDVKVCKFFSLRNNLTFELLFIVFVHSHTVFFNLNFLVDIVDLSVHG